MEASADEDDPNDLTTATDMSAEEAENKTRPIERLRRCGQRCVYGPGELATVTGASEEENGPKALMTRTEASSEKAEETTCLGECLQQWRRHFVYRLRVLTTTTAALAD